MNVGSGFMYTFDPLIKFVLRAYLYTNKTECLKGYAAYFALAKLFHLNDICAVYVVGPGYCIAALMILYYI